MLPGRQPSERDQTMRLTFLAPALLLIAVFIYWPLIYTFVLAFHQWNLTSSEMRFVGLTNFSGLLDSPIFDAALKNTAIYIVGSIPLKVLFPLFIALAIWVVSPRRGIVYKSAIFLPTLMSFVVVSLLWMWLLNPLVGIGNSVMAMLGLRLPPLLSSPDTALWTILAISSWKIMGFNMLLYLAGLASVNRDQIEAMRLDGAGDVALFRYLIWPTLSPTTFFVLIVTVIFSIQQVFTPIDILTHGGPSNSTTNLFYMVYQYAFQSFNIGYGAAGTVLIFAIIFVVTAVKMRVLESRVHYQ